MNAEQTTQTDLARYKRHNASGIPGAAVAFRATLTATTNEYLRDRLPLDGLVQIGERTIYGECRRLLFMPLDNTPTSFVSVPNARFEFASRL